MSERDPEKQGRDNGHEEFPLPGRPLSPREDSPVEPRQTIYLPAQPTQSTRPTGVHSPPPPRVHKTVIITMVVLFGLVLVLTGAVAALVITRNGSSTTPQATVAASAPPVEPTPEPSPSPSPTPSETPTPTVGGAGSGTPASGEPTASVAAIPPVEGDEEILNQGRFTLVEGYCTDLDSTARNWNVSSSCGGGDLRLRADRLAGLPGIDLALVGPGAPSRDICEAATAYYGGVSQRALNEKVQFCVRTGYHRYSWVQVLAARGNEQSLTEVDLHVVTWARSFS